jgi:hypothetical protein
MRIGPTDSSATPSPNPTSGAAPSPSPTTAPTSAAAPMKADRVEQSGANPLSAVTDWAKSEWSNVGSALHGVVSAPGVAAQAYAKAGETNAATAKSIAATASAWTAHPAAARASAIEGLKATGLKAAQNIAKDFEAANRLPQAIEHAAGAADQTLHAAGSAAKAVAGAAISNAPSAVRGTLQSVANAVGSGVSGAYNAAKSGVKTAYDGTLNTLPQTVKHAASDAVSTFESNAARQTAKASGALTKTSAAIGITLEDGLKAISASGTMKAAIHAAPALEKTPVLGLAFAVGGTINDVALGKKSVSDAVVANVGSTLASTAVTTALTPAITSAFSGAAIADVAAEAAGVAVASGPVGWTVAGVAIAAGAVGYGIYSAAESDAGQSIIDGAVHLDGAKVQRGLGQAADGIASLGDDAGIVIFGGLSKVSQDISSRMTDVTMGQDYGS